MSDSKPPILPGEPDPVGADGNWLARSCADWLLSCFTVAAAALIGTIVVLSRVLT